MRLIFSNALMSLVLGSCFMTNQSQEPDKTNTNASITLSNETVETTFSAKSTSTVIPGNTVIKLTIDKDLVRSEPTQYYQMSTEIEKTTAKVTIEPVSVTKQTTPTSVPERTTPQEYTTLALETVSTLTLTESATSDSLPSTSLHETTGGLTIVDLTSSGHHEYETTTATVAMTTSSTKALDPTTIISKQPIDMIESTPITFQTVDITTEAVDTTSLDVTSMTTTTPLLSTSQFFHESPELDHTTPEDDSLSAHSTPSTMGGIVRGSIFPLQTNWLLIIIVCAVIICVLLAGMRLFVQRRKKNASRKFDPGYVNGQSKKSKKKKGAENNAWAGPVHLEAEEGVECDGEVQGALMPCDGNRDEDMVLSTFSALETDDTRNGGVGGEGTKEAKIWEDQEPLLYIDEDVKEDNMGNRAGSNDTQEVNEKVGNGEKMPNGRETFCITTAV
ncbi:mucin-2 [Triplophysa rosa]|uniref:Mucin-5AC-like n=1 Tax=Triplophysa rosa TaxID=992332 RepID=A0A9W7WIZ1_TRIRA|nr:mucin-2 [Triplophysa rosa]KAI7803582.1 putative mucin-5AC-like [Triplophysa rosa]